MENLRDGSLRVHWCPSEIVVGIPHDVLVLGYNINTCDRLRLWRAEASVLPRKYAGIISESFQKWSQQLQSMRMGLYSYCSLQQTFLFLRPAL